MSRHWGTCAVQKDSPRPGPNYAVRWMTSLLFGICRCHWFYRPTRSRRRAQDRARPRPLDKHTRYRRIHDLFHYRCLNRSAGMISSRFRGDIFTKIQQNLQFYRHLPGRVSNPWDHTDPVSQAIAQLKDIYRGFITPISINRGLQQDVFTGTLWSTRILSQQKNFQETLRISSRFPRFP